MTKATSKPLKEIRTYEVRIDGYDPVRYSARSPGKARWRAFQDFGQVSTCDFAEFLTRSACRRIPEPDGIGVRIWVCGKPARRVIGPSPNGNYFMYDDSDAIMVAHHTEITSVPPATVAA